MFHFAAQPAGPTAAHAASTVNHTAITAIAIGLLVGATVFALWRNKLPRARIWMLVALGVVELGLLGSTMVKFAQWLIGAGDTVTTKGIGVGCGAAALAVLFACELWRTAAPKSGEGSNRGVHTAMALLFPSICIATGGIVAVAMGLGSSLVTTVSNGISGLL